MCVESNINYTSKGWCWKININLQYGLGSKRKVKICIIDLDVQGSLWRSRTALNIPVFSAKEMKEVLKSDYAFIFIDTLPYLNEQLPKLAEMSDVIVIPAKTGVYDLLAIEDTISIIKDSKNESKALIVFNMIKPNTTLTNDMHEAMEKFKIPIAKSYISDLVAFTRSAFNNGLDDKKAQSQIESLTREVLERIV